MTAPIAGPGRPRQPEVLISGTFDVGNYGDLLFPVIAEHRLGRFGYRVVPVAPTGQATVFADARPATSLTDALNGAPGCAGMLIGGGDIIHAWRASFLDEYRDGGLDGSAYPSLWFGASLLAALKDVPIAWNAPGMPSVMPPAARRRWLEPALAAADHIAVRDGASARMLPAEYAGMAAVVPDTAAEIAEVWDAASLSETFRRFLRRKSLTGDDALFCVQVRPGGWGRDTPASLAAGIERFAAALGLVPVLLSIGPSLGDREALRAVSRCLEGRHVVADDDPAALREVAAVIGRSRAYLGNSLHGYITAAAYGVPGAIVARPGFRKFAGFAEQIGRDCDVVRDWDSGLDRLATTLSSGSTPRIEPALRQRLDWHWQRIADAIARPGAGRMRRTSLLCRVSRAGFPHDAFGRLGKAFAIHLKDHGQNRGAPDALRP
jgi:polysaccharide pyruvyl transferase WcaK-like protein